jgi:outer membrane protein assembly factor BamB
MFGKQYSPKWGIQRSPLVYRDTVIASPLSESTAIVAFDKNTGRLLWKSPPSGTGVFTHQTPLLAHVAGTNQVILCGNVESGPPALISGFSADTGAKLWECNITRYNIPIPSPVAIDANRVFVAGGYTVGSFMLSIVPRDGGMQATTLFANKNCTPMIQTPVFWRNHIFASSYDEFHNYRIGVPDRGFACYDLDGNVLWQTGPDAHFDQGGFIMTADGLLYIMHGKTGVLHLLEVNPAGWKKLARTALFGKAPDKLNARWWSPLALSDGRLLARNADTLVCLDVRERRQ